MQQLKFGQQYRYCPKIRLFLGKDIPVYTKTHSITDVFSFFLYLYKKENITN